MNKNLKERNIWLYYLFVAFRATLFTIPIWTIFQSKFLTFPEQAFFASMIQIFTLILELPTGALADLLGKKKTLWLGALINGIGFVTLGMFPSLTFMWISSLLMGLGEALTSGADNAFLYDTLIDLKKEKEFPKIRANVSMIFQTTAAMAILMGGYMFAYNISLPYITRGIMHLLSLGFISFFVEPKTDSEKFTLKNYIKQTAVGAQEAFKNSVVAKYSLLFLLVGGFGMSIQRFFVQPFLVEMNLPTVTISWISSAVKLLMAGLLIILTRNKKIFNSVYFILILPFLLAIMPSVVSLFNPPWIILPLIGINLTGGARFVFLGLPLNKHLRSKYRATAMSFNNMLAVLIYATSNYLGGLFVETHSVREYFYIISTIAFVTVLPLALVIINKEKRKTASEQLSYHTA